MSNALGNLGIPTGHLGKIYGAQRECDGDTALSSGSAVHYHPQRLVRMYEQITRQDFVLEIFEDCRGLADYPACILPVLEQLSAHYPGSLFVNVRRDRSLTAWLQSVEQHFVGLELLHAEAEVSPAELSTLDALQAFRAMTFGQSHFDAKHYLHVYHEYQRQLRAMFAGRDAEWLQFDDVADLEREGYARLSNFLRTHLPGGPFPRDQRHSRRPRQAFQHALQAGKIRSQTGLRAD